MTNEQYMEFTRSTAIYPKDRELEYLALGLASEAGEVCGKIKKVIRDNQGVLPEAVKIATTDELGDMLWYITRLCDSLGLSLTELLQHNYEKLSSRKERGVIGGSGDKR
jgi:NTP pyrophosphatase (non-canonical NTP hydrolase)